MLGLQAEPELEFEFIVKLFFSQPIIIILGLVLSFKFFSM
jgi:hypothetical protein